MSTYLQEVYTCIDMSKDNQQHSCQYQHVSKHEAKSACSIHVPPKKNIKT